MSDDEQSFAINVVLDENVAGDRARPVREIRSRLAGFDALVSGVPVFRTAVNERTRSEVLVFAPLTVAMIAVVLAGALRSVAGVTVPVAIGGIGSVTSIGLMGFLGVSLSLSTMILPSVLLALGCAYGMHIVVAARRRPLETALRDVSSPVALSGLTTAIGFLAMATSSIDAIRELATYGAVGVVVLTAASLSFAPAVLVSASANVDGRQTPARNWVRRVARLSLARPWLMIVLWLAVSTAAACGISRLAISTDIILWFDSGSQIREDYEEIRREFSGITPVNVVVAGLGGRRVTRPQVVQALAQLSDDLEDLDVVGRVLSLADPLRAVHRVLAGGEAGRLPSTQALVEQYLLLLSGSNYLDGLISRDREAGNLWLRVDDNSSDEIVELKSWVDHWWSQHGPKGYAVDTTGVMYEFGRAEEAIAYGQVRGLALALAAIGIILLALLRDARLAIIALVPNVLPLVIGFGAMGFARIPLDAATVCLGSLALGIAVDDTVHLIFRYREHRRRGRNVSDSVVGSFEDVLFALTLSTISIAAGFVVLGLSEFTLVRNLGLVTAGLVGLCLAADATLLPALLLAIRRRAALD